MINAMDSIILPSNNQDLKYKNQLLLLQTVTEFIASWSDQPTLLFLEMNGLKSHLIISYLNDMEIHSCDDYMRGAFHRACRMTMI